MTEIKTKAIEKIETKMENMDADSIRYFVLDNAKAFKKSWIMLGQALYTVWKDKLYKNWGYLTFDAYTLKETGIRKQTALKLLRSYYFLEKEEPAYLKQDESGEKEVRTIPTLEAVDALRLASKKKTIDRDDYAQIKKKVFEEGTDGHQVKKDLTQMIRQREELDPEEARKKRRDKLVRRFISSMVSIREELRATKMLPANILSDINKLIGKLESEL